MKKPIYSEPKLCKANSGWFVYFRYNGKLFRYKYDLNRISNLKTRQEEFEKLAKAFSQKLSSGWNPHLIDESFQPSRMSLHDAIIFALKKKEGQLASKSFKDYSISVRFFLEGAKNKKLSELPIAELKRAHVKAIFEDIKISRNWSNHAYNKNLGYIKAIFSELLQWEIIEVNPAHKIKALKEGETLANRTATDEELVQIKKKLLNDFPNFYNFIEVMFHTGARPAEILHTKINMIDLKEKKITLPPEITKTDIYRVIPINPHLYKLLIKMKVQEASKDWFLFGTFQMFVNRGLPPKTSFLPAPKMISPNAATRLWKRLIKDDLGIDVNLYATKHLGGDKKILAGMDLDSLRELYGHTSKRMTERYARVIKEVYRRNIIEKSPAF